MTTETIPETTVPLEPTTPIKPSEAIRLGCLLAPVQLIEGPYVSRREGGACAFGAMALGLGGWGNDPNADDVESFAAQLHMDADIVPCPVTSCKDTSDALHLNDTHRWSRERIADWLESLGL